MREFIVPTILKSKPTGNISKSGKIYQNTVEYTQFKRESLVFLNRQKPDKMIEKCYGILIIGFLMHRGRAKDLGQLSGAIYDILTTAKIWKDDNLRVFSCSLNYYYTSKYTQGYIVRIAENEIDWYHFLTDPKKLKNEAEKKIDDYSMFSIT